MAKLDVDRVAFEKLVQAVVVDGDIARAEAAIEEMKLVHPHNVAGGIILLARKRKRGTIDQPRPAFALPVPGHLKGSTLGRPRLAEGDPFDYSMTSADRAN